MHSPSSVERPDLVDYWPELYSVWSALSLGYRKPRWERVVPELEALSTAVEVPQIPIRFFARVLTGAVVAPYVSAHAPLRQLLHRSLACFLASPDWVLIQDRFELTPQTALPFLGARRTAALWGFWLASRFPQTGRLLLNSQLEQRYASFHEIPLAQFIRYVPRFVLFRLPANLHSTSQIIWVKHLAKGNNLRRAPHLPFSLSRLSAHWTVQAPDYLTLPASFVYGMVRMLGGEKTDFHRIQHLYPILLRVEHHREDVVRLLIRHPERIAPDLLRRLLGYLTHRTHEEDHFSLAGRTLAALVRQMNDWYDNLHNRNQYQPAEPQPTGPPPDLPEEWTPLPFKGYEEQRGDMVYEILQLCTYSELAAEGVILSHCAASYAAGCAKGNTSIWSLRSYPVNMHITGRMTRLLTIELSADGRIRQARGKYNAQPAGAEKQLISRWVRKEGLAVDRY